MLSVWFVAAGRCYLKTLGREPIWKKQVLGISFESCTWLPAPSLLLASSLPCAEDLLPEHNSDAVILCRECRLRSQLRQIFPLFVNVADALLQPRGK